MTIDCILAAGGRPAPDDPLYAETQGGPKALLDVAGRPMVAWVLAALSEAPSVRDIVVVGLPPETPLSAEKVVAYIPDQGSLLRNGLAGMAHLLEHHPEATRALLACADIPLLTTEMVEWVVAQATDSGIALYYSAVPRALMEARFPTAGRSYAHFADGDLAGGDLHVARLQLLETHRELLSDLVDRRKSALKQALRLGVPFFVKLLLRRLTVAELERAVAQRWNLPARAVRVPYPELGMDVDKPQQLALCRQELAGRQ